MKELNRLGQLSDTLYKKNFDNVLLPKVCVNFTWRYEYMLDRLKYIDSHKFKIYNVTFKS